MMQTAPDITEYQEINIWNTIWDTIGTHSMKRGFINGSGQNCSHR
jgi:hypothetical protein